MTAPLDPARPGPARPDPARMSGLEILQAIIDGRLPAPSMAITLGLTIDRLAEGSVTFRGTPSTAHLNPMGGVHGGWYGTILDSAMGCAVMSVLPPGLAYTTLEYKVNLTRALRAGVPVTCTAEVRHAGRRTAVAQAEIRDDADRVCATGSTTCLILAG